MDLVDVWPLFGLRLLSPRLELRPLRDEDLPGLVEAALAGVHDPERMPFTHPWTDATPDRLARDFASYHWAKRASVSPEDWQIEFAVLREGRPIGVQGLLARDLAGTRTVTSGSWLTRSEQGAGLGTEMRAALLLFAFDHLGAEWAESSAAVWNARSLGVSARLGYRENGVERHAVRGESVEHRRLLLHRDGFRRPEWELRVEGSDAALAELGVVAAPRLP